MVQNRGPVGNGSMSIHDNQFDFATFLRAEARDAEADERTHPEDNTPLALFVSKQSLEPDRGGLSAEVSKGTDDQNGNAGRRRDGIKIDHRTAECRIQCLRREQVPVAFPSDAPRAPILLRSPAGPRPQPRNGLTLMKTLSLKFERPSILLSRSVKSPLTAVSPLRRDFVGAAALVLIAGAIVVVLGLYLVPGPSDPRTDLSGTSTSTNPQLVEAPPLPPRIEATPIAAQESAAIVGSLKAIQPDSIGDTVDPEIKPRDSSEAKTPESASPVAFASVNTPASSENPPSSELPKPESTYSAFVAARTLPLPPVEAVPPSSQQSPPIAGSLNSIQPESLRGTLDPEIKVRGSFEAKTPASSKNTPSSELPKVASTYFPPVAAHPLPVKSLEAVPPTSQQSAPPSRVARGTTASLSQSTPPTVGKTTALHPDTQQPHIGDVTRPKHDQKPSKALETGSCTADIFPGYAQASARGKTGQLDVRKICADQHASFMVSLRCLVASAVCPNLSH